MPVPIQIPPGGLPVAPPQAVIPFPAQAPAPRGGARQPPDKNLEERVEKLEKEVRELRDLVKQLQEALKNK